jgi:hypothetical protein
MGNSESIMLDTDNTKNILNNNNFFNDKYNLVPSFPGFEYHILDSTTLKRKFSVDDKVPNYIDLRTNFPQILNTGQFAFNPIVSVIYLLHYQLLRNNLPVFPPSSMYIFRHITFYKQVKSLFSFESIFKSIKENGFCSENEFNTNSANLTSDIPGKISERANAFKFIEVYRVEPNLDTIKILLSNKYPLIVGFSVYYDFNKIESYMWMPDINIDKKLGGLSGVLVGYIEDRKMFIMASTFGQSFGTSGYLLVPYDYIINTNLTFEIYTLDFIPGRVDGYINQRKEIINLENNVDLHIEHTKKFKQDQFGGLFQ